MERKEATLKTLELAGFQASEVFSRIGQAKKFLEQQPIFYDKSGIFWIWNINEKKWEISDETDILNQVMDYVGLDTVSSKNKNEIINAIKQMGRKNMPIPIQPTWIQFKDIIIDIKTGDSFEASPKYFVTNPIPYKLHPEFYENTPNMDKIFEEWVGKENVKLLYQILAYCLLPDYPIHRIFCLIGSGMNGKSCFLRLLRKFVGSENVCATELDTLMTSRFEVTRLYRKLVCQMGETNFSEIEKTSIIKKLSGQDIIGFEYKNKTPFEDVNYAKIIIATNNLPTTTDKTVGFYRRWAIIEFPNQFSEKRDILAEIPEEEYQSLALKSINILKELLKDKFFYNEGSLDDRIKKYESKSDFLQHFINEFITEEYESYITVSDFNKKFSAWCRENRHRELSETSISKRLKEMGFEQERKYFNWMFDNKGGYARVWVGKKWK